MKTKPASGALASEIRLRSQRLGHDHKTTAHLLRRGPDALATLDRMELLAGKQLPLPGVQVGADRATLRPFASFGEYLRSVREVQLSRDVSRDPRLLPYAASGMSEGVPSDGGFTVPTKLEEAIFLKMMQEGALLARTHHYPIDAPFSGVKITAADETSRATGQRLGGVQVAWADEAATALATKPKLRQIEVVLRKLIALVFWTNEFEQDSAGFSDTMTSAFAREMALMAEIDVVSGLGTGGLLGLLKSPALITVPAEGAQAAGTFVSNNAVKIFARLFTNVDPSRVCWIVQAELLPQIMTMSQVGLYVAPVANDSAAPFGRLIGRPVIPCEASKAAGAVGDVILADLSQYLLADKDAQVTKSLHIKFLTDEMAFRVTYRLSGQPIWSKAVTPLNGNLTVSSHVTLAAR